MNEAPQRYLDRPVAYRMVGLSFYPAPSVELGYNCSAGSVELPDADAV